MEPTTQEAVLKLVPTEPTAEMLTAAAPYCRQSLTRAADIYRAMVARAPTPEPMQADLRETGVQAFERYPALASWIEKMGNSGSALSLGEWMVFVGALNAALVSAEQAAMQAKSAPVAWSPLATAPKDGSEVELFIVHRNAFVSSDPVGEGWVEVCRAHWIDHNGGGWTWNGLAGSIIGWRPVAHPSPSAPNPDLAGLVEAEYRPISEYQGCGPVLVVTTPASPKYLPSDPVTAFRDVTGVWRCLGSIGGCAELALQPTHFAPMPKRPDLASLK